ncbi:alpha/beta hydrolase family protein [Kribbella catacumbae]|uniref:alpha/beta hydrolase family protein n=1 Tax=Kribbella catacumbae TaxID=460086 RepID=UPI00037C974B|nr:alpha/beta fold hydrolase [Kribbella catacumbae]
MKLRRLGFVALVLSAAVACSSTPTADPTPSPPPSTAPTAPAPSSAPPSSSTPSTPADPVSLQALMAKKYDGRDLRPGRVLARTDAYTRYYVTYASGKLTISGILNVPLTPGRHPALVLNHGYIDPAVYTNGRGLMREQDYLARRGYVVLHTDYRNHAQSSKDPQSEVNVRLGYTEDVINAVLALKASPYVDPQRVGLFGRSMGGGITYNVLVAQPGLVKAAVVYAAVSSNAVDNFNRWTRPEPEIAAAVIRAHGDPAKNPAFWRNLSAVNFFDRITEPLLIQQGLADSTCPPIWAQQTLTALKKAGKQATLHTYPGEEHAFAGAWPTSMARTVAFLKQQGV